MSKTMFNFVLDCVLLVMSVSLLFTSAVLRVVFPPASAAAGWTLWGGDYDAWSNAQFALVSIIGLAILLHVMMHWSWVVGVLITRVLGRPAKEAKADSGMQTVWGAALLIVIVNLLGALVGLAYVMIEPPATL